MIVFVFFLSLIALISPLWSIEHKITLESPIIEIADGTFINADKIELLRKFRRELLAILLGDLLPNGERKKNGIQALALQEQELKSAPQTPETKALLAELAETLLDAKAHFMALSKEFMESGRGSKNILVVLIEEDCAKRNRLDSPLLEWAKTAEGHEEEMFEKRIVSYSDYYHFSTDLANFLLDLIHNCPKAEQQFKERVIKWGEVKKNLPKIMKKAHIKADAFDEIDFLKYLKDRYLDKLELAEITTSTIAPLLAEYIKQKSLIHD